MTPATLSIDPSFNAVPRAPPVATSPHQRALLLRRFGGPEGFELVSPPMPSAGDGEVRIRVLAASVQFTDLLMRKGKYPDLKEKPPLVLGYDVVGEIDEVGPGVSEWKVGDRVADLTITGSYARYRTLRADHVVRVPPHVDPAEATALVLTWATAYQLLHRAALIKAGERVLVIGAAGAVGQALLALGRRAGLEMWGTARPGHLELVRFLGAAPVNVADVRRLAPRGFDAVIDGVGDRGFMNSWAYVRKGGRLIAFGFTSPVLTGASMLRMGYWLLRLYFVELAAEPKGRAVLLNYRASQTAPRLVPGRSRDAFRSSLTWSNSPPYRREGRARGCASTPTGASKRVDSDGKIILCP